MKYSLKNKKIKVATQSPHSLPIWCTKANDDKHEHKEAFGEYQKWGEIGSERKHRKMFQK